VEQLFRFSPPQFANSNLGTQQLRINTYNYSGKLTLKLNDSHQVEASVFGDPAHSSTGAWRTLLMNNTSGFSKLEFGSRNFTAHYNGALSPSWLLNVGFAWMHNKFDETSPATFNGAPNFQIVDFTQTNGLANQLGLYTMQGVGFIENTKSDNYGFDVSTSKVAHFGGEHTFSLGYKLELPRYNPFKDRSGGSFAIPDVNAEGNPYLTPSQAFTQGQSTNAQFQLLPLDAIANPNVTTCTACPVMTVPGFATPIHVALQQIRGEFGPHTIKTSGVYQAVFANDSWTINKHVTLNYGLRWEQQKLKGTVLSYTFTDNWSPRLGISVDPTGDRKTKLYANFGRYDYAIPLDLAERSLSSELDFQNAYFAPAYTNVGGVNTVTVSNGTVSVIPDATHLLNGVSGSGSGVPVHVATSHQGTFSGEGIVPGTRMQYLDEFVVGAEREAWGGVILSARYLDRRLKRIVEDTGGISPEAAGAGVNQTFVIANVGSTTDIFTNPVPHTYAPGGTAPAACSTGGTTPFDNPGVTDTFGNVIGAVCFEPTGVNGQDPGSDISDGVPDGFPNAIRNYQAVELEANKSFSHNWMMRANWRIAKLFGNYEGAFRNDNGQSDPSISSLYDFTAGDFGLLGAQFTPGYLNTDRRHVVNGFFSYVFDRTALKGLTVGTGIRVETGTPLNDLKAHPVYGNSGEVPIGGRGALGRNPLDGAVDAHLEYAHALTEKTRIRLGADLFNIANSKRQLFINQNEDLSFGVPNADFKKPATVGELLTYQFRDSGFQRPFYARFMVKFEF